MSDERPDSELRFDVGSVVHHRRYQYRGVIVGFDRKCEADEAWYYGNKTQPPRDQPWYHVLVHGAAHTTYVAQSNLGPDASGEPIVHPLMERFFTGFRNGRYVRDSLN